MRATLRTRCSAPPSGPMQASRPAPVFQIASTDCSMRQARTSSSARSAVRRSASSRSAIRLPFLKKLPAARSAWAGW